jgi:hypothetical protein
LAACAFARWNLEPPHTANRRVLKPNTTSALFCWTESGLRIDGANLPRAGLGFELVYGIVTQQLGGTIKLDWRRSGLAAKLTIPLRM